jgi:hypothetical protein
MSVALIVHYLGPCLGIGQYSNRLLPPLITELNNQNIQVKIVASPNAIANTPALQQLVDITYKLSPLDYNPLKRYFWVATRLSNYCERQGIKAIVWLSNPMVLPWHPPTLTVIHDVNEWKNPRKYNNRFRTSLRAVIYVDASIHFAQKIITVSQATADDLLYFNPSLNLKQKLTAIPNGIDSTLVNLPSVPIDVTSKLFVLSVGRIEPVSKRLSEAVALVKALREFSNHNWELHIVGGIERNNRVDAEDFLNRIKNLSWVHYHSYVSNHELAEYYRRSTAVVFLSDHEGFGLPIAEAASFNRWTIVSCNNQVAREAGGNNIITVDPDNPESAARKVLSQLQQAKVPNSDRQNIQEQQNTWEFAAKQYAEEIKLLVAK